MISNDKTQTFVKFFEVTVSKMYRFALEFNYNFMFGKGNCYGYVHIFLHLI